MALVLVFVYVLCGMLFLEHQMLPFQHSSFSILQSALRMNFLGQPGLENGGSCFERPPFLDYFQGVDSKFCWSL